MDSNTDPFLEFEVEAVAMLITAHHGHSVV